MAYVDTRPKTAPELSHVTNWAVEYFAYVGLIGLASAGALLSLVFAANVAVGWLDAMVKPEFLKTPTPVVAPQATPVNQTRGTAFAMLATPELLRTR